MAELNDQDAAVKGRDIVVISIQPWYYELGSNCKNIATHFSKHNRVLYVNIPITRKTYLLKKKSPGVQQHCNIIKKKKERIREINENMWEHYPATLIESINRIPSTTVFRIINKINNRRFAADIKYAIKRLNFKDIILFNDNDIYNGFDLKKLLSPSLYIYYCRDFLQGYDYWKKHASVLEPQLIKKADLVTANSTYYAEYCSTYNPHSYYIGQGCNFELFDNLIEYPLPNDLNGIASPVIGYVGALDSARLDEKIIGLIATANKDWNIVLAGPEDDFFTKSHLHNIQNIYFLGRKQLPQLPAYVKAFDVCINPQLINNVTRGNYPLKVDEYLAMGKPVVASRTKAMKLFEDHTYLADKPEEYAALIEKALKEDNAEKQEQRIAFAKSHTWENSMNELYKVMAKHLALRK